MVCSSGNSNVGTEQTSRFSVLTTVNGDTSDAQTKTKNAIEDKSDDNNNNKEEDNVWPLPSFSLHKIFQNHQHLLRNNDDNKNDDDNSSSQVPSNVIIIAAELHGALSDHGGILITCSTKSTPGDILTRLQTHVVQGQELFPNHAKQMTSEMIYISERDVPMYRLGYERTDDQIREIVRLAAGLDPDQVHFLSTQQRCLWLQSIALLRHITDAVLDLVLFHHQQQQQQQQSTTAPCDNQMNERERCQLVKRLSRPYSLASSWRKSNRCNASDKVPYYELPLHSIRDRPGDFSVFYAMHYFNQTALPNEEEDEKEETTTTAKDKSKTATIETDDATPLAVKAHVDPSLCVVEPFLWPFSRGLQIWHHGQWLDCDGPQSPLLHRQSPRQQQQQQQPHDDDDDGCTSKCTLLLFAGRALQQAAQLPKATLHRVVHGECPRRTVIYEQKYAEFFN